MAYKINGTQVIDDDGKLVNFSAYNLNNDDGQIEIQSNSPMVGTVSGYSSGGFGGSASNVIDKFPFANESTSTDVGDLTKVIQSPAGHSSEIFGYVSSGGPAPTTNTIEKFPFSSNSNARDVGDLSQARGAQAGQSSFTHGYTSGGSNPGNPAPTVSLNTIDKFPFSADSNATDVGDLTQTRGSGTGHSSTTEGFMAGAYSSAQSPTSVNTIDKFSFAVNNNASDVGDLAVLTGSFVNGGKSSKTHGYVAGGSTGPTPTFINTIQKFQFSTSGNATDIADLAVPEGRGAAGQNSITSGYHSGGRTPTETYANDIQKFPFATDSNATEVGSLTVGRYYAGGQQD
jgi:hypothetical protein